MVFDPSDPVINEIDFDKQDWASNGFGHLQGEVLTGNIPEPRCIDFSMILKDRFLTCYQHYDLLVKDCFFVLKLCINILGTQETNKCGFQFIYFIFYRDEAIL